MTVKLYGTLSRLVNDYNHQQGLDVTMPAGESVQDLLDYLSLGPERIGMIFVDGRPAKKATLLNEGAQIKVFQPIFGG